MTPPRLALSLAQTLIRGAATDVVESMAHEPSFWLRGRLVDLETRALTGQLRWCGHGGPLLVGLWADNALWCAACAVTRLAVDDQETYRCDRCRVVSSPLSLATLVTGAMVIIFGLCGGCRDKEAAAA